MLLLLLLLLNVPAESICSRANPLDTQRHALDNIPPRILHVNALVTNMTVSAVIHPVSHLLSTMSNHLLQELFRVRVRDADVEISHAGVFEALVSLLWRGIDELEQLDSYAIPRGQDSEFDLSHLLWVRAESVLELLGVCLSSEVSDWAYDLEAKNLRPPVNESVDVDAGQCNMVESAGR